ncbi:hypothetical protein [Clostridium sp. Marseille-QA1073]
MEQYVIILLVLWRIYKNEELSMKNEKLDNNTIDILLEKVTV